MVIVIIALISITLIGSSFVAIFQPGNQATAADQNQKILLNEYNDRKQIVDLLSKKLEKAPSDVETQLALGNAYYDKFSVSKELNLDEYKLDLTNAIKMYQEVLKNKEDNGVLLKLANSALLAEDSELAGKTYQELLQKDPTNPEGLYGNGMYLFYLKEDYQQALLNWQKALSLTNDQELKQRLGEMIARVQGMDINSNQTKK